VSGEVRFLFEGRPLTAREGDTVAAALIRSGVHVFGRSSKYHRPRGYRCGRGHCSSCAMRVDGLPGVRTCVTLVCAGMTVEREHAWPSADHDLLRAADALSPLMPPGFYYHRFRRSPRVWGAVERGLAHAAAQGGMPSIEAVERLAAARCERRATDVLVVGGGAAGMSAALAAAAAGARVLLVHRGDRLGGGLADDVPAGSGIATDLGARVTAEAAIEVLTGSDAFAWYEEGTIAVGRHPDLLLVDAAAVVLATGGYDAGLPFPNWDLPGVMTVTAARRLVDRHGVLPGSRAVLVTGDDHAYTLAARLVAQGVDVACIADVRGGDASDPKPAGHPVADRQVLDELAGHGVDLLTGLGSVSARGIDGVRSVTLRPAERPGNTPPAPRTYDCDTVCYSAGARPADDLAYQARCAGSLVLAGPRDLAADGVGSGEGDAGATSLGPWTAGLAAGVSSPAAVMAQGEAAGEAAAAAAAAAVPSG
jgi:sarcosine oxidase subunit alpha